MILGLFSALSAASPAYISSYGFLDSDGAVINSLGGEGEVRAYADISNRGYDSIESLGELWLECYADGILFESKSVILTVDSNTAVKRMVTAPINIPAGEIVLKVYITQDSSVIFPEVSIGSGNSDIPNAEQDGITYKREIEITKAFEIMVGYEDGSFRASQSITRAELAVVLTKFTGKSSLVEDETGATPFSDVSSLHWASGYINIVTKLGLMTAYSDNRFMPDSKVSLQQAAYALVNALGYSSLVGPLGHIDKANTLGITAGTNLSGNSLVSRGALAKLLVNSLEIPIVVNGVIMDGYGASPYLETIMSKVFSAARLEAVVTNRYDLVSLQKQNQVRIEILNNFKTKFQDNYITGYNIDI